MVREACESTPLCLHKISMINYYNETDKFCTFLVYKIFPLYNYTCRQHFRDFLTHRHTWLLTVFCTIFLIICFQCLSTSYLFWPSNCFFVLSPIDEFYADKKCIWIHLFNFIQFFIILNSTCT